VHKAPEVLEWLDKHQEKIEVFYLPSYSPELNPDELLLGGGRGARLSRPGNWLYRTCPSWSTSSECANVIDRDNHLSPDARTKTIRG